MNEKLAAVRVGRRKIGVAVFSGVHLEHADCRVLCANENEAERSLVEFVTRIILQFDLTLVAVEEIEAQTDHRAARLQERLIAELRTSIISIWHVSLNDLMHHWSIPVARKRHQLRLIALGIWPILSNRDFATFTADAALLGLYVQAERLLSQIPAINQEQ